MHLAPGRDHCGHRREGGSGHPLGSVWAGERPFPPGIAQIMLGACPLPPPPAARRPKPTRVEGMVPWDAAR